MLKQVFSAEGKYGTLGIKEEQQRVWVNGTDYFLL